ncbi:MAG: antibiotic biosynthesis monooxygenase [Alphaproteobacteria bacterium]|nr:antibiotic biosynthesis monooxygenase [Alphaproteobacteria bacterium]
MLAVIFEFRPDPARQDEYFALAQALRAEVEGIDGFLGIERFESLSDKGKFVSLSYWRDEAAVAQWRNRLSHRRAQAKGRGGVFVDYRLRVAKVLRDYTATDRNQIPEDSR